MRDVPLNCRHVSGMQRFLPAFMRRALPKASVREATEAATRLGTVFACSDMLSMRRGTSFVLRVHARYSDSHVTYTCSRFVPASGA
ncbi:hypothetical protein [Burkholderia sp. PU8-34]